MQVMDLYEEFFPKVLDKIKISTVRFGHRDDSHLPLGFTQINATKGQADSIVVDVTNKIYKTFGTLTEEDAINDGFNSLQELKDVILAIYKDRGVTDDSAVTIAYFDVQYVMQGVRPNAPKAAELKP
ncbi:MAG: ASCH domain-containing protein [Alphaproteobacteria bacterium]|nr:ASCH domain-containing protein [Alphaproteobacteria bacterium]